MAKQHTPSHRVAAVIEDQGRYLMCRVQGRKGPTKWEFPSGHPVADEGLAAAVAGVVGTRLRMAVVAVGEVVFAADEAFVPMKEVFFRVTAQGEPILTDYCDSAWFSPAEIAQLDTWLLDKTVADILRRGGH